MKKYLKQYNWPDLLTMIGNLRSEPKICGESFKNRLVIITGATSGIGYEVTKKFASNGAQILSINRDINKSKKLCDEIKKEYGVDCNYLIADFSKLNEVQSVAKKLSEMDRGIDVLIHNAGVFSTKKLFTEDDIELVFQTNYLSTFILNNLLKEKFKNQNRGRILYINSEAHRFAFAGLYLDDLTWDKHIYTGLRSYGASKMAQLLSMMKFKEDFNGTNVTINAMHPGKVTTNSGQNNGPLYKIHKKLLIDKGARDINISSEAIYFLAVSTEVENKTGKFFNLTTEEIPAPPALDHQAADELWEKSFQMVK